MPFRASCFPPVQDPVQDHLLYLVAVSLVSFNWETFISFPLSFMTLTLLKSTGQFFYGPFLSFGLSGVCSWCDSGYAFPAGIPHMQCHVLHRVTSGGHMMSACSSLVVFILITQSGCCLVAPLYSYCFPFWPISNPWGNTLLPYKCSALQQTSLPGLSILFFFFLIN